MRSKEYFRMAEEYDITLNVGSSDGDIDEVYQEEDPMHDNIEEAT